MYFSADSFLSVNLCLSYRMTIKLQPSFAIGEWFQFFSFVDNEKSGSRDMIPMDELGPGKCTWWISLPSFSSLEHPVAYTDVLSRVRQIPWFCSM